MLAQAVSHGRRAVLARNPTVNSGSSYYRAFQRRGIPTSGLTRAWELNEPSPGMPPSSYHTTYTNRFDHVEHPSLWEEDLRLQVQHNEVNPKSDTGNLVEFNLHPHYQSTFLKPRRVGQHYHFFLEPPFVPEPILELGELAAGANLYRTTVWRRNNEPAIVSIGKFSPDNFRAAGYAENIPNPQTMIPRGYDDFEEVRLKPGHADRRPFHWLMMSGMAFTLITVTRAALIGLGSNYAENEAAKAAGGPVEVDITAIKPGEQAIVKWKKKPIFVKHRTPEEIDAAKKLDGKFMEMRDPATDEERTLKPEWLVVTGICTHLGCIPGDGGNYGGYFCSCHGSHYDTSGRIWEGPAPTNLEVPPYYFIDDNTLEI
eukprot:Selendium_serpulae@DN5942_c0_g1_i1.p1